jgi:hypothetical protein
VSSSSSTVRRRRRTLPDDDFASELHHSGRRVTKVRKFSTFRRRRREFNQLVMLPRGRGNVSVQFTQQSHCKWYVLCVAERTYSAHQCVVRMASPLFDLPESRPLIFDCADDCIIMMWEIPSHGLPWQRTYCTSECIIRNFPSCACSERGMGRRGAAPSGKRLRTLTL